LNLLSAVVLAATTVKAVGVVIAVIIGIAFVTYLFINVRAGRAEVASEIELAPNRKPYFDDEVLEGPRLTRALSWGLVLLAISAVGLPLYWLNEPGRQSGAVETFDQTFVNRGARLFAPTDDGGYNCAGCHGAEGVGGQAPPFTLTDTDSEFVATVTWRAPALDTVLLRFDEEELRQILVYGRPGTPMPAWGAEGGGPLTTQQIDELIAYIESIQITSDQAKAQVEKALRTELGLGPGDLIDYTDPEVGKTLFNLGLESGEAGGAYSCARCHTKGASFRFGPVEPANADLDAYTGYPDGTGAFGFDLTGGVVPRQFLTVDDLVEFLMEGSEYQMLYGQRGQGSGRMPGFGDNPDDEDDPHDDAPGDGMFTDGMLRAVALYEASLGSSIGGGTGPPRASEGTGTGGSGNAAGGSEAGGDADQVDGTTNTTDAP
jgi:mono/diheme cytochrome c family protein